MRVQKCRACGAAIVFIHIGGGKAMPCQAQPVSYWLEQGGTAQVVTPNGELLKNASFEGDTAFAYGVGYVPHWGRCKRPDLFRRAKAAKAKKPETKAEADQISFL